MMIQQLWSTLKETLIKLLHDARSFIKEEDIDPIAFGCVINMAFQLGLPRLSKFKKLFNTT